MNLKTAFAVLAAAFAAAALEAKDQYDIRPGESSSAALTAVEWQATNATRLAAATTPEALSAHVATADECILPGGTAYQTDVGMAGPFHSIIGRNVEPVLDYFKTGRQTLFDVAKRDVRINGVFVDVNLGTGKAVAIDRFDFRA